MSLGKHIVSSDLIKVATSKRSNNIREPHLHAPAYGARFYTDPVPKFTMPTESMPAKVAFQIVHDELTLDGNPAQNLASFVSTWMEPEAEQLILESMTKNFADFDEYPQTQVIHQRCVSMLADLFHAPLSQGTDAVGTSSIGSSEAFMLAGLAFKFTWRNKRKAQGKPYDKPNIIFGANAQVCLEKFALYFDVEQRLVEVSEESNYCLDAKKAVSLVDENTIAVVGILGSTFTGHFEPIKELNDQLLELNNKTGWDVPIHVDAASGGFVAPFHYPELVWDFRLPLVRSINVSGHKYGLVFPGVGWCIWRSKEYLPTELVFNINYLGGNFPSFTLNFSRNACMVVGQYYNFLRLGSSGYKNIINNCAENARFLADCVRETSYFKLISDAEKGLPLVAFSIARSAQDGIYFDEYDISAVIRQRGWIIPAYNLPKNCDKINILRIVVREIHSEDTIEQIVQDLVWAYETLRDSRRKLIAQHGSDASSLKKQLAEEDATKTEQKKKTAEKKSEILKTSGGQTIREKKTVTSHEHPDNSENDRNGAETFNRTC
eukprot:TRINITY_DN1195_c0_g1_i1.p1 TRINITY_DN1195_c0_g1~~TRINITY_DN1195_c0_g1_i1.p1  ORF type:complete len:548 (-),score=152.47 TRINITY_DN1195_c0_g1_i1:46-1689(-)